MQEKLSLLLKKSRKNDSQKRMRLWKAIFSKKVEKTKKQQEMRKATKKQTKIATRRKDKGQEKCAPKRKRKTKQREQSEKW